MKATIMQENLAKALGYVSKAISSFPSIPILANVLIEAEGKNLKLSATDLELGISTSVGADVIKEGKTTIDAKTITEFINSLEKGKVELNLGDKVLTVKNEKNSADFNTISHDEFPPLPQFSEEELASLDAQSFSNAVKKIVIATASDDSRPVLTGVLFETNGKNLNLVGVDGFRLAQMVIILPKQLKKEIKQIVPAKALIELARITDDQCDKDDKVEIYIQEDKNQMLFKVKDSLLSTRLIEGEFPDYKQIIPSEGKFKFKVEKSSLAQTVKVVSIFARSAIGNKSIFEINPEKNELKFSAQVADVGENESTVEIHDIAGDQLKTAYNTKFLSDMLATIDGDEILFETNGVTAPGVFKDIDDKNFLHIIMPMRID